MLCLLSPEEWFWGVVLCPCHPEEQFWGAVSLFLLRRGSGVRYCVPVLLGCSVSGKPGASSLVEIPGTLRVLANASPTRHPSQRGKPWGESQQEESHDLVYAAGRKR